MKVSRIIQTLLAVTAAATLAVTGISAAAAPGGGEEEGYGNNLSMPIVFADGYGLTGMATQDYTTYPTVTEDDGLRPRTEAEALPFTELGEPMPYLDPADKVMLEGVDYYAQKGPSVWKAFAKDAVIKVKSLVYFGDNLTGHQWTASTKIIHLEMGLQRELKVAQPGYPMTSLSGEKSSEVFGTTGEPTLTTTARVYTPLGHLVIKKLNKAGKVAGTLYTQAIYEGYGVDGGNQFAVEVTGSGALSYAYNWWLRDVTTFAKAGGWRIIFKIDKSGTWTVGDTTVNAPRNAKILGSVVSEEAEGEGPLFPIEILNPYKARVDIQILK